jgi:hypothetical protein
MGRHDGEEPDSWHHRDRRHPANPHDHALDGREGEADESDDDEKKVIFCIGVCVAGLKAPCSPLRKVAVKLMACLAGSCGFIACGQLLSHDATTASFTTMSIPSGPEYSVDRIVWMPGL